MMISSQNDDNPVLLCRCGVAGCHHPLKAGTRATFDWILIGDVEVSVWIPIGFMATLVIGAFTDNESGSNGLE